MNNNRKLNQPIRLTEQDLHFLVEESVKGYLRENGMQEDVWGGLKNAWNGVKQGNLHVGTTYKTGNWASSFQKYAQQVSGIIQKMQGIAQKSGNQQIYNDLASVRDQFFKTAQAYNQMAQNAANTTPQFNTQVKSGFANNQQPQGQVQQPQGQGQQLPPIPTAAASTNSNGNQPKLNAMGKPIEPTNPKNGLMSSNESRRPRRTIR